MFTQIPNMHLASYMDTGLFVKKQSILTVENKQVKHGLRIFTFLEAVQLQNLVVVIHHRGHQTGGAEVIKETKRQTQLPTGQS